MVVNKRDLHFAAGLSGWSSWVRTVCWSAAVCIASSAPDVVAQNVAKATNADTTAALVAKAIAFEHGEGVPKDPQTAVALYCVAARAGNQEAQYDPGWMFANGRG